MGLWEMFRLTGNASIEEEGAAALVLEQAEVAVVPGEAFGTPGYLRLSYALGDDDLDRHGLHNARGEVTLRELLATWAVHDLDHVAQIYAAMAASHDAEVGPWKAYLGILLRRDDPAAVATRVSRILGMD